ncbi:MAG: DUF4164 domain-containing protein [Pseudomonadota bacterium]
MQDQLKIALADLSAALERLETVIDDRLDRQTTIEEVEDEVVRMRADRVRLVETLDESEARSGRLVDANAEVSNRLVGALESIRAVLDRHPV